MSETHVGKRRTVGWDEDRTPTVVDLVEELDALLDTLHNHATKHRTMLVDITYPPFGNLSIALGEERSVLCHTPTDGLPPYHVSQGSQQDGNGLVTFW